MPSCCAVRRAFVRSLEAMAVTSDHSPSCIPGMTFLTAILATPKTPHLIFFAMNETLSRPTAMPQRDVDDLRQLIYSRERFRHGAHLDLDDPGARRLGTRQQHRCGYVRRLQHF